MRPPGSATELHGYSPPCPPFFLLCPLKNSIKEIPYITNKSMTTNIKCLTLMVQQLNTTQHLHTTHCIGGEGDKVLCNMGGVFGSLKEPVLSRAGIGDCLLSSKRLYKMAIKRTS